jgi:hypothetical protein
MGVNCRCDNPLLLFFANVVLLGGHSAAMTTVWQGQHTRTPLSTQRPFTVPLASIQRQERT